MKNCPMCGATNPDRSLECCVCHAPLLFVLNDGILAGAIGAAMLIALLFLL
ncbi:MAG TPA: hypothetical protein VMS79_02975 [Methanomassiliicoccales archaeon]|nr:hypothetical protein [Methanomassiliicoccales archaeon]